MRNNRVMLSDSYKYSHTTQYPDNMVAMYDYMEARKNKTGEIVFFGAQYILKEYLSKPIETWEALETIYLNGDLVKDYTFDEIRKESLDE